MYASFVVVKYGTSKLNVPKYILLLGSSRKPFHALEVMSLIKVTSAPHLDILVTTSAACTYTYQYTAHRYLLPIFNAKLLSPWNTLFTAAHIPLQ